MQIRGHNTTDMSGIPFLPADIDRSDLLHLSPDDNAVNLNDVPIENFRPFKVIVIGAGFSGINCAIRIPERLRNVDLTVYEKNSDVGGTWWENRYPGCACDIPGEDVFPFQFRQRTGRCRLTVA